MLASQSSWSSFLLASAANEVVGTCRRNLSFPEKTSWVSFERAGQAGTRRPPEAGRARPSGISASPNNPSPWLASIQNGWVSRAPHRDLGTLRPIVIQFGPKSPPGHPHPLRLVRRVTSLFARDRDKYSGHHPDMRILFISFLSCHTDNWWIWKKKSSGDNLYDFREHTPPALGWAIVAPSPSPICAHPTSIRIKQIPPENGRTCTTTYVLNWHRCGFRWHWCFLFDNITLHDIQSPLGYDYYPIILGSINHFQRWLPIIGIKRSFKMQTISLHDMLLFLSISGISSLRINEIKWLGLSFGEIIAAIWWLHDEISPMWMTESLQTSYMIVESMKWLVTHCNVSLWVLTKSFVLLNSSTGPWLNYRGRFCTMTEALVRKYLCPLFSTKSNDNLTNKLYVHVSSQMLGRDWLHNL